MNEIFADRSLFSLAVKFLGLAFATGWAVAYYSRERSSGLYWLRCLEFLLAIIAWGMLSWALFSRGSECGRLPLANIFEVFQSLGWCALFFVVFLRAVWNLRVPVFLGSGLALGLCVLGQMNAENWDKVVVAGDAGAASPWIGVHATLSTVGYACFSAAVTVWVLYILQNSALRKRFSHPFFSKLPDLSSLDRIAGRLCASGLMILGTGMAVGIASVFFSEKQYSCFVFYKTGISFAVFLGFLTLALLRNRGSISALKFARFGVGIFIAALILLGGSACIKNWEAGALPDGTCAEKTGGLGR